MRVAVLSDTHAPRFWKSCPVAVARALEGVDLILHAGDLCTPTVLEDLARFAPVHAVLGNNDDPSLDLPERLELELDGLPVAMVHDSGPARGRGPRLRQMFPAAELVVFGHSHIPWDETFEGQRAINPGSPTDKRRQPQGTMGELIVTDGRLASVQIFATT